MRLEKRSELRSIFGVFAENVVKIRDTWRSDLIRTLRRLRNTSEAYSLETDSLHCIEEFCSNSSGRPLGDVVMLQHLPPAKCRYETP